MEIHGLRPELQPEVVNKKAKEAAEANKQADNPVRGHDDVAEPAKEEAKSNRILDIKG